MLLTRFDLHLLMLIRRINFYLKLLRIALVTRHCRSTDDVTIT
jgi:hypothetical protein